MNEHDLLITLELFRALGGDEKTPTEVVFSEQFRPEVRFLHINVAGLGAGNDGPAVRVTVPPGERWIMDTLCARGVEDSGSGGFNKDANYFLNVNDTALVGQDAQPELDMRTCLARQTLPTIQFTVQKPFQGFRSFIGSSSDFDMNVENGFFSLNAPYTFYENQQIFVQSFDVENNWDPGDELQVRARYLVFPEHLLNFSEALRDDGPKPNLADVGTWNISKSGAF